MFFSKTEDETNHIGQEIAQNLEKGDIILLSGDLGAGKSVLARSIIRELTGKPALEVPSPTFTLVQTYETEQGDIWHFDLYRLKAPAEIFELGWEDALAGSILLVEWPDRLGPYTPKTRKEITIMQFTDGSRRIDIREIKE